MLEANPKGEFPEMEALQISLVLAAIAFPLYGDVLIEIVSDHGSEGP